MLLVWSTARYEKAVDVTDWLRQLSLAQYADAFAENAIDWAVLPTLTAEDLRDIGVVAVGHRRRLLDAMTCSGWRSRSAIRGCVCRRTTRRGRRASSTAI